MRNIRGKYKSKIWFRTVNEHQTRLTRYTSYSKDFVAPGLRQYKTKFLFISLVLWKVKVLFPLERENKYAPQPPKFFVKWIVFLNYNFDVRRPHLIFLSFENKSLINKYASFLATPFLSSIYAPEYRFLEFHRSTLRSNIVFLVHIDILHLPYTLIVIY